MLVIQHLHYILNTNVKKIRDMNGQQLIPNNCTKLKAEVLPMLNSFAQFGEGWLFFVKAYMELKIYGNIGTRFPKSLSHPPSPGELRWHRELRWPVLLKPAELRWPENIRWHGDLRCSLELR